MNTISISSVKQLLSTNTVPCLSFYLPTTRTGEGNRIRYKNLVADARERVRQRGLTAAAQKTLLEPAEALYDDDAFWREPSDGVAAFCSPGAFASFRVPYSFPEVLHVGERPYIKPLLPLLGADGNYHLLAVSEKQVKLFAGTRYSLAEVHLDSLPANLMAELNFQHAEGQHLVHTGQPALAGKAGQVFYGQGGVDRQKTELVSYFREIDRAVAPYLRDHGGEAPLVFCGVEYLFPIYESVNSYRNLFETPITGNFDRATEVELLAKAQGALSAYWEKQQQSDVDRLGNSIGSAQVSADVEAILPAAYDGRIEALFVAADAELQGVFDHRQRTVALGKHLPNADDLLDVAAAETLLHGGRAYAVKTTDLPAGLVAAALYRYS